MKFKRKIMATLIAVSILSSVGFGAITQSACSTDSSESGITQPENQKYELTLHLNGGTLPSDGDITEEVSGFEGNTKVNLPVPVREGYTFDGWFDNDLFLGSSYRQISASNATSNKEFWAKWSEESNDTEQTRLQSYSVTLHKDGGSIVFGNDITSYTAGTAVTLPVLYKTGYNFDGWYEDENKTIGPIAQIPSTATGNKDYYAKFTKTSTPDPVYYNVTFETNGGTIMNGSFSRYEFGVETPLPTDVVRNSFNFAGWYSNDSFAGNAVTSISKTDSGNKTFYAKWNPVAADSKLKISDFAGYEEGAYIEFNHIAAAVSDYTVSYKLSDGVSAYTSIDSDLIREINGGIRADIVGLKKGNYDIKVEANGGASAEINVQVTAYDRSGYAHFNKSDVGAYNSDGTPKRGATIVYVTEETKNTVTATVNGKIRTGLVEILKNATDDSPLIVRIIGTIGAATWNEINYDKGGNYNDGTDYDGNNHMPLNKVVGKNGKVLPTGSNLSQADLIKGGYNTLDTSEYEELNGLSSVAKWDSSKSEWDSYWNMCDIDGAKNVTVEGIGTDARIFQWGFTWKKSNSIEVRNLTFEDYPEDACAFEGGSDQTNADDFDSQNLWVHHNTFLEGKNYWDLCPEQDKHEGDGATDLKKNSYITISYNHYFENHKTGLVGGGNSQKTACITFHHNWYEDCNSRLPLGRQANMHMYNNYYDGTTGTNMSLRAGAYAFIEYCYFDNAKYPIETQDDTDYGKGVAKVYQCVVNSSAGTHYGFETDIYNITIVADRSATVSNDNIYNKNFDTDPQYFYYDVSAKITKTDADYPMLTALETKELVPGLAGVHKK